MKKIVKVALCLSLVFCCTIQQVLARPGRQQRMQSFYSQKSQTRQGQSTRDPEMLKMERRMRDKDKKQLVCALGKYCKTRHK